MRAGLSGLAARTWFIDKFKQVANPDLEILAQGIEGVNVHPVSRFLVQEGNRVSVQTRVTRYITDFELSLPH
jgi:hypothetical protein